MKLITQLVKGDSVSVVHVPVPMGSERRKKNRRKMKMMDQLMMKGAGYNPNRDAVGRFSTGPGGGNIDSHVTSLRRSVLTSEPRASVYRNTRGPIPNTAAVTLHDTPEKAFTALRAMGYAHPRLNGSDKSWHWNGPNPEDMHSSTDPLIHATHRIQVRVDKDHGSKPTLHFSRY